MKCVSDASFYLGLLLKQGILFSNYNIFFSLLLFFLKIKKKYLFSYFITIFVAFCFYCHLIDAMGFI